MTLVFVPREKKSGETRVAATAETIQKMVAAGLEIEVERGAGEASAQLDDAYAEARRRHGAP